MSNTPINGVTPGPRTASRSRAPAVPATVGPVTVGANTIGTSSLFVIMGREWCSTRAVGFAGATASSGPNSHGILKDGYAARGAQGALSARREHPAPYQVAGSEVRPATASRGQIVSRVSVGDDG